MFKKNSEVRGQQRLSGADRKKLRRTLKEHLLSSASDDDVDLIIPPKADMTVTKMTNRALVYAVEGGAPMLFDADGRGTDLYPTVFALWKLPNLVPSFVLKGAEVSKYVLSGADLMLPGVQVPAEGLPQFEKGEVWSVRVPLNNCPIAVGSTLISSKEAEKGGMRGKLLRILHYYRDTLWESAEGQPVPNEGFQEDIVREDPALLATLSLAASSVAEEEGSEAQEDRSGQVQGDRGTAGGSVEEEGPSAEEGVRQTEREDSEGRGEVAGGQADQEAGESGENGVSSSAAATPPAVAAGATDASVLSEASAGNGASNGASEAAEAGSAATAAAAAAALTPADMDKLLDWCLLQALSTSVKPSELPLAASSLWSNHIVPCRPPGSVVDVKKSTHKKLSKWLQTKTSQGLLAGKEDKHRKEYILSAINYKHPELVAFQPVKRIPASAATGSSPAATGSAGETGGREGGGAAESGGQLEVEEVFKVSSHVTPIFTAVGEEDAASKYYSAAEARQVVLRYVEQQGLRKVQQQGGAAAPAGPDAAGRVVLDPILCDALFKNAIKKGAKYPEEVHFKELGPLFLARMVAHHRVTRGGAAGERGKSVVGKGGLQPVQILSERRQGNKKVTKVTGLETFLVDAEALAVELQKRFACSTSVGEVPGKKGKHEVLVQGGVMEELAKLLIERYGIPRKHIEVLDKTRK